MPREVTLGSPGPVSATVDLYHFTTSHHLASILTDGFLRTTESNLSRTIPHAGPPVVWLTADGDREHFPGLAGGIRVAGRVTAEKREIRFTVRLPSHEVWTLDSWAAKRRMNRSWLARMKATAGAEARAFRLIERPITRSEWVAVELWDGTAYRGMGLTTVPVPPAA